MKTKPRMTFLEAVFATILFDLALFGTDNLFINSIIRLFTKFQNSWDRIFQSRDEAKREIIKFCQILGIQTEPWIWEKPIEDYNCLNDFFSRRYAKPLNIGHDDIVSPASCTITIHGNHDIFSRLVVKGCDYALEDVGLHPLEDLSQYSKHPVILGYLCPADYHRFHAPLSGKCIHCKMEQSDADSASVKFFGGRFNLLNRNKRLIIVLEDTQKRRVALVIIGGVGVNTIVYDDTILGTWVEKGDDLGTFRAGGSAFCLFSNFPIKFNPKLIQHKDSSSSSSSNDQPMEVLVGESFANFTDC